MNEMETVKIKVDMDNREKLRRLHTATHIINFCAREVLGNHVWQNGSNLKPEFGTLDITHYENLTSEQIALIEKKSNDIIFENKKVNIELLDRNDAEQKYGYTIYQGGAIPMKQIRIITVLDSDIEACGGIHMESTGGIGFIKIVDAQKIQDGVVRLKYVVRDYAIDEISKKEKILKDALNVFSVDESSLVRTSEKFFNEWKEQKKEIERLKEKLKTLYKDLILNFENNEFVFEEDFDMGFLTDLFTQITPLRSSLMIEVKKFIIATKDFEVDETTYKKQINKGDYKIYIK